MTGQRELMLVGSVPLDQPEAVMTAVAGALGKSIRMIPDGETGPRSKFISWQEKVFAQVEQLSVTPLGPQSEWGPNGELPPHTVKLRDHAKGEPKFPRIGYAKEALKSYEVFSSLKREGKIARDMKFQVCLPTPLGVLSAFGDAKFQEFCEPNYRARMKEDLEELSAKIPHGEFLIQWDLPLEIAIWEGHVRTYLPNPREAIVTKLCEMIEHSPRDIGQGLHLCYGDVSHRHWKEPDLQLMVDFTNAVQSRLSRPLDYAHFPIPKTWIKSERYRPLKDLRHQPGTKLFLGLVHRTDGFEGTKRRIEAAKVHLSEFGLGASCGLGRRKAADIPAILTLHRQAAELDI